MDVFCPLQNKNTIVLFTFTAELKQLSMRQALLLSMEALKLNSFKWRNPVQFFIDEERTRLISWCALPLATSDTPGITQKFDALARINKRLREAFDIHDAYYNTGFTAWLMKQVLCANLQGIGCAKNLPMSARMQSRALAR